MRVDQIAKSPGAASARSPNPDVRRRLPDGQVATPARNGGVDPLAELARLVQQDEAFGAVVRNTGRSEPRVEWARAAETPASLGARADIPSSRDWEGDEDSQSVAANITEHGDGLHDAYEYGDRDEIDDFDDLPPHRRWLRVSAAIIGLALVGSAGAFAYWAWFDERVSIEREQVTSVSTAAEKPLLSSHREDSSSEDTQGSIGGGGGTVSGTQNPTGEKSTAGAQALPPVGVSYGAAPAQVAALTPAAAPPDSPTAAPIQPPVSNDPVSGATTPGPTTPEVENSSKYIVQLSSQRSEAAAQATSRGLQTKYADVFGGLEPFIRRSDFRDRGVYYGVQIGPFSTIGEAKQLCGSLKKSGADCVVQKN